MVINSNIPIYVRDALNMLENSGFKAYLVGGCIRDSILGHTPKDWDITTNALPEQIMEIFPNSVPTGIKHGTITVVFPEKEVLEVTTFRIDGNYIDFRRPENVYFSKNLYDDLSRRDFTMNSIAYSPKEGILDPFGGVTDINNKLIRCVGQAQKRFSEDALRMMRAVRFSSVLGFELSPDIPTAVSELNHLLTNISAERIRDEFSKTIVSNNPDKIYLYRKLNLMEHFLPEFNSVSDDELKNILSDSRKIESSVYCRLAYLLYKFSNDDIIKIMKRLKFDNKTIYKTKAISACLNSPVPIEPYEIRLVMGDKTLKSGFSESLYIRQAVTPIEDTKAHNSILQAINMYNQTLELKFCTDISMLAVNGYDLDKIGIKDGKEKGSILKKLLEEVLADPSLNTHEKLIEIVPKIR